MQCVHGLNRWERRVIRTIVRPPHCQPQSSLARSLRSKPCTGGEVKPQLTLSANGATRPTPYTITCAADIVRNWDRVPLEK